MDAWAQPPSQHRGGEEALCCVPSVLLQWPASGGLNPTLQSQCPSANVNPTSTGCFQHPEPFNSADKRCCNFGLCKLKNEANQPPLLYLLLFMVSAQSFTELESEGSPAQSEVTAW